MPRFAAFLRAINVGGHTVRMADLKRSFEVLGFDHVETFIASGNVIFETGVTDEARLERVIERGLEAAFGYPVETFVRSMAELSRIVARDPFGTGPSKPRGGSRRAAAARATKLQRAATSVGAGASVFVAFLDRRPTREASDRLTALATDDDTVAVVDRELYWLRRDGIGTSKFSGGLIEKTLGMPATLRGLPTLEKIVTKYG